MKKQACHAVHTLPQISNKEWYCQMSTQEKYDTFTADMRTVGYAVEPYHGRDYYEGPSVRIERRELQDVIRATTVKLQWDSLGKSEVVVYPRE
jgi:hypothetical protein